MILQCEKCQTEFSLDEALLKKDGSKVRCSACKHVFMAYPPEPDSFGEDEFILSSDNEIIGGELKDEEVDFDKLFDESIESMEEPEEVSVKADIGSHEPAVVGDDGEETGDLGLEPELTGDEIDFDDLFGESLGETEEDSVLAGIDADRPVEKDREGLETDETGFDAGFEDELTTFDEAIDEKSGDTDAFGEDIFAGLPDDEKKEEGEKEEPQDVSIPVEEEMSTAEMVTPEQDLVPKRRRLTPLLIVIIVIIAGLAAIYFFAPDWLPFIGPGATKQAPDRGARHLSLKEVTGSFVETDKSGSYFVIRGKILNQYPKGRRSILLKGSILDDKGNVIKTKQGYAGNTFTDEEIKTMSIAEIDRAMKRMDKKSSNVAPGGTVPFMMVFDNLPDNLSVFSVEAIYSTSAG